MHCATIHACALPNFRMNRLLVIVTLLLCGCALTHNAARTANSNEVLQHPEDFLVVAVANDGDTLTRTGSTAHGYDSGGIYAQSARARLLLRDIAREYRLQSVKSWPIKVLSMECVVFKPVNDVAPETVLARLQHDSRVMLAQPLNTFATNSSPPAVQESKPDQPPGQSYESLQRGMQRMDIADAHRWSRGRGIRIAVVDTGMDMNHPDLKGRISTYQNFVDHDQGQFDRDRHGTAVAGVIAANSSDGAGISGVAPDATLLALKACWQLQADRDEARCNSFTLAQAMAGAIALRAQIINLSVVGPSDPLLAALIKQAQDDGIIVVGAADDHAAFPAQLHNVIAVSAMEQPAVNTSTITAPGRDVLTLVPGGKYDFSSGSSIATGEVSGMVALLLAGGNKKQLNSERLAALLKQSVQTDGEDNFSSVNACRALSQMLHQPGCRQPDVDPGSTAVR